MIKRRNDVTNYFYCQLFFRDAQRGYAQYIEWAAILDADKCITRKTSFYQIEKQDWSMNWRKPSVRLVSTICV